MIGDLEVVRDLPLKGARLASIRRGWVGHQLRVSTSSFSPRNSARMRCDGNLTRGSLNSK
jgi:hypothetical protein